MRTLATLAFLALAAPAAARTPPIDHGLLSAVCADEGYPFRLPPVDVTSAWTDAAYWAWIDAQWRSYCARPETATATAACKCTGRLAR